MCGAVRSHTLVDCIIDLGGGGGGKGGVVPFALPMLIGLGLVVSLDDASDGVRLRRFASWALIAS